ncbi:MAG TPA: NAD(P)H-hydrate dehydratase [Elusimicrobiales bacterium]|nr:NAD(P)H-hydrate dehydratase [Elusimicrobiales bacterium]
MKPLPLSRSSLKPLLPPRPRGAHKGDFGRLLVIAGSRGMNGAAVVCARAALRAGAGLVTAALPESERAVMAAAVPEAMTLPLPGRGFFRPAAAAALLRAAASGAYDLAVIGPGLSMKSSAFALRVLRGLRLPVVVDADALNALAASGRKWPEAPAGLPSIVTPHPGEFARLFPDFRGGREAAALRLASRGPVAVLKGPGTLVACGKKIWRNATGGPELAKGGSGDALAGIIGGLWAQLGLRGGFTAATACAAARLGVWLHGTCGSLAARRLHPRSVTAMDLVESLPAAFGRLER